MPGWRVQTMPRVLVLFWVLMLTSCNTVLEYSPMTSSAGTPGCTATPDHPILDKLFGKHK